MGQAYLAFAQGHARRWRALFQHQLADGRRPPDGYVAEQARLFRRIEAPLQALRPDLPALERVLLARSLFSATHGIVMLGLDARLMVLPVAVVRDQLDLLIRAMATGLANADGAGAA
ncbi:WHG domain-containing protein [Methylobacterium sp. WL93]|uniref:TetR-like C-terminal domain-containing protein n=1 Tax=Methylobacterium sp. WL93 TaxID=2603892 RepID=UPI0011C70703|nr:TetR-like C-terminal domain-containing protein [Methylobacterium sp. WL93]TXN20956.1 WHG domain-containing protein [Methylobacterium sp. WL93]